MARSTPGSRLKAARKQIGLTQLGVATLLSQSVDTYKGWEQDRSRPRSFTAIRRLCDILHISADHYISGTTNTLLQPDEKAILERYRQTPKKLQDVIHILLDVMTEKQTDTPPDDDQA